MKSQKTWFLPPDFTFQPGGPIALGRIIPDPSRPTATLASLADHPRINLPEVKFMVEDRSFSDEKNRSFGCGLFANILDTAGAGVGANVKSSRYKNRFFGAMAQEVRTYDGSFTPETLRAILELDEVKRYVYGGWFCRRSVYIISGLRIAHQRFTVMEEKGRIRSVALKASGPTCAAPFAEVGAGFSKSKRTEIASVYTTAPGIVFAYRLHVIRPKDEGLGEVFSHKLALFSFPTGGMDSGIADMDSMEEEKILLDKAVLGGKVKEVAAEAEAEAEWEIASVDETAVQQDLEFQPYSYGKRVIEDEDESYVVFEEASVVDEEEERSEGGPPAETPLV
ncbi:hypothetical protein GGR50DRAFT_111838 [Xylaria sp. CBS 124048]|nr:hypothetical protein GGR50DRAFT_111838 [Xylaria sp. CBS 124048]